jgi:hypothetical protein
MRWWQRWKARRVQIRGWRVSCVAQVATMNRETGKMRRACRTRLRSIVPLSLGWERRWN